MPVLTPKQAPKLESISKRLRGELIHPNRPQTLFGLHWSPDGNRFIAGGYPDGVVAVWDIAAGRVLTTVNTRVGDRSGAQLFVSRDGQTLFAPWQKQDYEQFSQDGKHFFRWKLDGGVRAWDVATGQLRREYKHDPPRGVMSMELSPDGTKFATFERLSGTYEGRPKWTATLWDVSSGRNLQLFEGDNPQGRFSPDGRRFVLCEADENGYAKALRLFDTAAGRETRSIPVKDSYSSVGLSAFSPDGRIVVADCRVYEAAKKWDKWQLALKGWDVDTGSEVISFAGERNEGFAGIQFSPDGRTLAVTNWQGEQSMLNLLSVADKQPAKTVVLGKKNDGERLILAAPAFSPDGRRLVVIARRFPDDVRFRDLDPRDVPQPRIHLIDVATGEVSDTLVAPPSFMYQAAFSPDGRTLATDGHGKVLLWDVTSPDVRR